MHGIHQLTVSRLTGLLTSACGATRRPVSSVRIRGRPRGRLERPPPLKAGRTETRALRDDHARVALGRPRAPGARQPRQVLSVALGEPRALEVGLSARRLANDEDLVGLEAEGGVHVDVLATPVSGVADDLLFLDEALQVFSLVSTKMKNKFQPISQKKAPHKSHRLT